MYTPEVVGIMGEAVSCFELPIDVGIHQFFCTKSGGLNSTFSLSCIFHCVSFPFVQCRFKTCVCLLTPLSSSVVLFRVCFTFLLPSCSFAFCMPLLHSSMWGAVFCFCYFFSGQQDQCVVILRQDKEVHDLTLVLCIHTGPLCSFASPPHVFEKQLLPPSHQVASRFLVVRLWAQVATVLALLPASGPFLEAGPARKCGKEARLG